MAPPAGSFLVFSSSSSALSSLSLSVHTNDSPSLSFSQETGVGNGDVVADVGSTTDELVVVDGIEGGIFGGGCDRKSDKKIPSLIDASNCSRVSAGV